MRRFALVFVVALLLSGPSALAGGFLIYEHGAAATGMADARTALSDDVSALYYNPAAITELPGLQVELGVTGILPYIHYDAAGRPAQPRTYTSYENGQYVQKVVNDGENSTDATLHGFTPIHLYASWRIGETGFTVGFGLNNPFGLGTYWPNNWDGRFITTETEIQTFYSQPLLALDLATWFGIKQWVKLSLAGGYDFVYGTARLAKKIDLRAAEQLSLGQVMDPEGEMRLLGNAFGVGWNVALFAELPGLVAVGASIRSHVSMDFSGDATFSFNAAGKSAVDLLGMAFPDKTTGTVSIDLPLNMNFGVAFLGVPNLKIAADFYLAMFESYDQLKLQFSCVQEGTCTDSLNPKPVAKNWGQSWQFSIGAEYRIAGAWAVRAGYGLVSSPVPASTYDPSLPDGQRNLFSLGAGYTGSFWKVDVGYMVAFWKGTKANDVGSGDMVNPEGRANGQYSTVSHLLALSVGAWF